MSYINTIDINGEVYNLGNLTDGDHVVDLPALSNDDIFLLRGDVVNNLTSSQSNKPLAANQGRVINQKISDLSTQISNLKQQSEESDAEINNNIESLRSDMNSKDAETLSSAKSYANELKGQSDDKATELNNKITQLDADMKANDSTTLSSANKYTDDSCATINSTIDSLKSTVESNKNASELEDSNLKTYINNTFIEKSQIADNLVTDSSTQVLSAKQGKVLDNNKFDKVGGAISGDVTISGVLTMSNSTKGISVTKVPSVDADVTNKKYVDAENSKLNSTIETLSSTVDTHGGQITTIQQSQTNLQNEFTTIKEQTKYEVKAISTSSDGATVTCSFEVPEDCIVWVCVTPSAPTTTNAVSHLNYSQMLYTPVATAADFYYSISDNMTTDTVNVGLVLTSDGQTSNLTLKVSLASEIGAHPFNVCVVSHPM